MPMTSLRPFLAPVAPLALAALVAVAQPAAAEKIPLAVISQYLNSLTTAEAGFTQTNADGSVSEGRLLIKRPGRARFEYAPPETTLVLAGSGQVAIFDGKSNQPPAQYPLSRTPLTLILAERIDLGQAKMVVGHREVQDTTRVVAQDPAHPEIGTIELVFTASPVALRQWIITDETGSRTTVTLGPLRQGADLPNGLFNIQSEIATRSDR